MRFLSTLRGPDWAAAPTMLLAGILRKADWNVVFREINRHADQLAEAVQLPPLDRSDLLAEMKSTYQQLAAKADELPASLDGLTPEAATEWVVAAVLSGCHRPALQPLESICSALDDARTASDLVRIALALAACSAEHGRHPETLTELVPAYLDEIPTDPYSRQPYMYRRTDRGYIVYSIGDDLRDDGGDNTLDLVHRHERPTEDSGE